jgi:hypothetical protein
MTVALPSPLVVAERSSASRVTVVATGADSNNVQRALAFGSVLSAARAERSLPSEGIEIFAPEPALTPPPSARLGELWVPHVFCWRELDCPALAWERCQEAQVPVIFEAKGEDIARWARRPDALLELIGMAVSAPTDDTAPGHLSMRWILAHELHVAELLTAARVRVEHVSLHVEPREVEALVSALADALGMIEIGRPSSITVPGRWLQAGPTRVHLNSRPARPNESGFPGTAPNHICFAVADLDKSERALQAAGFVTTRAGSLGSQTWLRLSSGTVIELQPLWPCAPR